MKKEKHASQSTDLVQLPSTDAHEQMLQQPLFILLVKVIQVTLLAHRSIRILQQGHCISSATSRVYVYMVQRINGLGHVYQDLTSTPQFVRE